MKENVIKNKSFDFALKIIQLEKELSEKREFVIGNQILKSGTSIGLQQEKNGCKILSLSETNRKSQLRFGHFATR